MDEGLEDAIDRSLRDLRAAMDRFQRHRLLLRLEKLKDVEGLREYGDEVEQSGRLSHWFFLSDSKYAEVLSMGKQENAINEPYLGTLDNIASLSVAGDGTCRARCPLLGDALDVSTFAQRD